MAEILKVIWLALLLAACARAPGSEAVLTASPSATPIVIPPPTPEFTTAPSPSPSTAVPAAVSQAPSPSSPPAAAQVCSPLDGISLAELPGTISNPFHPPPPGSDDPHQGVDFSDLWGENRMAIAGRPVLAVLSGRVAAVIAGRFPYGNAILVETRLDQLPAGWTPLRLQALQLPTPAPTLEPRSALTCPPLETVPDLDPERRSLYLLYAHLQQPPALQPDEDVQCGGALGAIGSSGNALNPHLHLEARLGPAGWRFNSLAHYDASASTEEMANYCLWRVSNRFQLVDPLRLLAITW